SRSRIRPVAASRDRTYEPGIVPTSQGSYLRSGLLGRRFVAGQQLAQGSQRWVVEVHTGDSGEPPLEPLIELILGLGELRERVREVGALHVGQEQVALRSLLQEPVLLDDTDSLLGGGIGRLARPVQFALKVPGVLRLARQYRQCETDVIHSRLLSPSVMIWRSRGIVKGGESIIAEDDTPGTGRATSVRAGLPSTALAPRQKLERGMV